MSGWRDRAACIGITDLMYAEDGSGVAQAIRICKERCSVMMECRREGIHETQGVWGGLSQRARQSIRNNPRAMASLGAPPPIEHGTYAAAQAHWTWGVPLCVPCELAVRRERMSA